ncbi:hypothetical protein C0J52_04425, partial [Blattella germanica]
DSENDGSDIDSDNESVDDNITSILVVYFRLECVKLSEYSSRGRHSSGDALFRLQEKLGISLVLKRRKIPPPKKKKISETSWQCKKCEVVLHISE